jgi:ADP-heptose:LPS heptosyltransferase
MRGLLVTSTRLGDAILSTGVLDWMLGRGLEMTVACGPVAAPVFEDVPGVARVIAMQKGPMGAHWRRLWAETVGARWDLVVDLRGSAFAWTVRAGERRIFRAPPTREHRVDQLASALDISPTPEPRLWISDSHRAKATSILGEDPRPILALCPTANWPPKAWPAKRFVELIDGLTRSAPLSDARVLVAGGPNERDLAAPVLDAVPDSRRIDLVGTAPLMVLAACLARCKLVVANDSGLMHLAAASGTPTLGLFGPSKDAHYAPRGPVTGFVRGDVDADTLLARSGEVAGAAGSLMQDLQTARVLDAARGLLNS